GHLYLHSNIFQGLFNTTDVACTVIDNGNHILIPPRIARLPISNTCDNPSQLIAAGIRASSKSLTVNSGQHINANGTSSIQSTGSAPRKRNISSKGASRYSILVLNIPRRTGVRS